ncbi:MAG: hypothetical protein GC160_04985 [Acidobacteria bacterium]|nr:hypothetical protein [Acidobacteriota bacterium]
MRRILLAAWAFVCLSSGVADAQPRTARTQFEVTYVAADVIYVDAGSEEGLAEGMELEVRRLEPGQPLMAAQTIASVKVIATSPQSAVCEVAGVVQPIVRGDFATLSSVDAEKVAMMMTSLNARQYAQVVEFSDFDGADPLEDEQREYVPRPPLHEINRTRGRISFQQSSLFDHVSGAAAHQAGLSLRTDVTRINGTYWNFGGNWRGRINSRNDGATNQTLTDLINRTYNVGLRYENPNSKNRIGVGRLLLPWASSLSTIDGGYYGRRLTKSTTVGAFGGTMPNPTAWNYDPNRQIAGVFSSFEKGSFEKVRYSGTLGAAHTRRSWRPERQFGFFQNTVSVQRRVSVYHNAEVDYRSQGRFGSMTSGPVLSRSYLTVRTQASDKVSFDVSHNYFRGVPTADTRLLGSGLLDDLLFQGLSAGMRVQLPERSAAYFQVGRSVRNSDTGASWNYMLGYTRGRLPWLGLRGDIRTSRFSSSFGSGRYHTLTLSRDLGDAFRFELQVGQQNFSGALTSQSRARFANGRVEWLFSRNYFVGLGLTGYRGQVQNYDQVFVDLGYRF